MGIVRVQLHNEHHYPEFHKAMAQRGFTTTIRGSNGTLYSLPRGTYFHSGTLDAAEMRDAAQAAATEIGANAPKMVIATSGGSAWSGLEPV